MQTTAAPSPVVDTRAEPYWLAALPPPTYAAECAAIRAHGRTRQAVRNGEDVPEHVLDWWRDALDDVDPLAGLHAGRA